MKIAIVGCGAIGSYYGAMLARAGENMHFLLRSDYQVVKRDGVRIRSTEGEFRVHPATARTPEEIGPADLVLVGLKTTANDQFPRLLPPLVGPQTALLTLQNGLGNEESLARLFGPSQVLGGLCFVCLNRVAPGVVHHSAHGQIVLGEFEGRARDRTHEIARLFRRAGVPCGVADDLARVHWEKLVWNIPFNGLGVAGVAGLEAVRTGGFNGDQPLGHCLTTSEILAHEGWAQLASELMLEVIRAARSQGYELSDKVAQTQLERTRSMGAYKASTLLDFEKGLPLELESLFGEPLRRAQTGGASMPLLERLWAVLKQLDGIIGTRENRNQG